jgi:hypothetical protein
MIFTTVFTFLLLSFLYTFITCCDDKFSSTRECVTYMLVSFTVITLLSCLAWYVTE